MERERATDTFATKFAEAWASDHVHLIIMPTEKCNFRCVYCYEDFIIGRMKRPVIDGIKAFLRRRAPTLSSMEINWFGGEPTLVPDIVEEVMAQAQALSRAYNISLIGGMTTNGYLLTGESYRQFHDLGVTHYQITLDGPAELHDTTRVLASGRGSFDVIWNNLLAIRNSPGTGEILLRLHLTSRNVDQVPALQSDIARAFGDDPRFRITLQRIEQLGGPNDLSELVIPAAETGWGHRAGTPGQSTDGQVGYVCYAAKANSYVFRADGRIGKCTVALHKDTNTLGHVKPDGTLEIDAAKLVPWLTGWNSQQPEALACPAAVVFT